MPDTYEKRADGKFYKIKPKSEEPVTPPKPAKKHSEGWGSLMAVLDDDYE
jgi:hypothetical protein